MSKQGIVPRSLELIFQKIEDFKQKNSDSATGDPKFEYKVRLTFVQLYNEKIFDMMDSEDYFLEHKLRYNARDMFFVEVELEAYNDEELKVFTSKLILVDLAGSEKIYSSIKDAKTKEESININRSLFSLRKVITALAEGKSSSHVPFRDSKLTCLLKQSLGGDGHCLMIGCILPTEYFTEDNLATLNYAYKANNIVNSLKRHEDPGFDQISKLKHRILMLEDELSKANKQIEILNGVISEQKIDPNSKDGSSLNGGLSNNQDSVMFDRIYEKLDNIQLSHVGLETGHSPDQASLIGRTTSNKLMETMNLFKELLVSNQQLRSEITQINSALHVSQLEKSTLMAENQELREQLGHLKTQASLQMNSSARMSVNTDSLRTTGSNRLFETAAFARHQLPNTISITAHPEPVRQPAYSFKKVGDVQGAEAAPKHISVKTRPGTHEGVFSRPTKSQSVERPQPNIYAQTGAGSMELGEGNYRQAPLDHSVARDKLRRVATLDTQQTSKPVPRFGNTAGSRFEFTRPESKQTATSHRSGSSGAAALMPAEMGDADLGWFTFTTNMHSKPSSGGTSAGGPASNSDRPPAPLKVPSVLTNNFTTNIGKPAVVQRLKVGGNTSGPKRSSAAWKGPDIDLITFV